MFKNCFFVFVFALFNSSYSFAEEVSDSVWVKKYPNLVYHYEYLNVLNFLSQELGSVIDSYYECGDAFITNKDEKEYFINETKNFYNTYYLQNVIVSSSIKEISENMKDMDAVGQHISGFSVSALKKDIEYENERGEAVVADAYADLEILMRKYCPQLINDASS